MLTGRIFFERPKNYAVIRRYRIKDQEIKKIASGIIEKKSELDRKHNFPKKRRN